MKLIGKRLPRRTFLRGAGVVLGLPVLDAMLPSGWASVAADAVKSPLRTTYVYIPNGVVMNNWTPAAEGAEFEMPRILKPLEPYRDQMLVVSGLMDNSANALGDGGGDHARAACSFLTGAHPKKTGGSDINVGISADQIAAKAIGHATRLPSLELGLDDSRIVGHCDSGYSCAYSNSVSWSSPTTPVPPVASPRAVFERLFGDIDTSLDAETLARRAKYRRSILELTRDETQGLVKDLGAADRRKIDEYLSAVRDIEKRIAASEKDTRNVRPPIEAPAGIPAEFTDHAKLLFDLQVIAFQTDVTRITTMMIGREGSVRTYEQIGVPEPHHPLSHHKNDRTALEKLTKVNTYHVQLLAHFIDKLKNTPDGDGTLLDHSMILYGCAISDSNSHTHTKLPVLVMGSGGGSIQTGRHIDTKKNTPVSNLLLAMLNRMEVRPGKVGDSTGALEI